MTEERKVRDDLSYVRSVLARAESTSTPAGVYFLWAVITFFGFAIIDYFPEKTGFYWMIAGPSGGALSALLGWRAGGSLGQHSRREGREQMLHWGGLMAAILLLIPLAATHAIAGEELPRLILLLVAFSYFTAGLYLDGRLLWIGAVDAGCYLLTVFQRELPYLWTLTATVLALSLAGAGILAAARSRRQA